MKTFESVKVHDIGLGQFVEWLLLNKDNQKLDELWVQERFYWDIYELLEKENRTDIKFLDCYLDYTYNKDNMDDLFHLLGEVKALVQKSDKQLLKSINQILEHLSDSKIEHIEISGI